MGQPHDAVDRLFTEVDHLDRLIGDDDPDEQTTALALAVAKRVRRSAVDVVRALADRRDSFGG